MGLFEKKSREKSREVDVAVDDLAQEAAPAQRAASAGGAEPRRAPDPPPPQAARQKAPYGIEHVVALMRSLPLEQNSELVGEVVRRTLESANVSIDSIIADARHREEDIHSRIEALTQAIEEMQREMGTRRKSVADLQKQLAEIIKARDLLAAPLKQRAAAPGSETPPEPVAGR